MRRCLALLTVVGVGLVGPVHAAPGDDRLVHGDGEPRAVGEQALELIDYPWRRLGWPVHFLEPRDGLLGLTRVEAEVVEIYVRPGQPAASVAAVLAHEIAHVVDLTYYSQHSRDRWLELRNMPGGTPWWPCADCTDFDTGAGDFAETFAHWLVPGHWRGQLAGPPTPDELDRLRLLLNPRRAVSVR
jgi:hypothetical protein